jgi:hypothetical protein
LRPSNGRTEMDYAKRNWNQISGLSSLLFRFWNWKIYQKSVFFRPFGAKISSNIKIMNYEIQAFNCFLLFKASARAKGRPFERKIDYSGHPYKLYEYNVDTRRA